MNKYLLRTGICGILVYFIARSIFPKLNIILLLLVAGTIFTLLNYFVPPVRRFFNEPK